jgi:ABC-type transport system involved in multi-copper enzyme maturation permease subunit
MSILTTEATLPGRRSAQPPADRAPSLPRLVRVELRKAVDTRAGFWLLTTVALLSCVVVGLRLVFGQQSAKTLEEVFAITQIPAQTLLSVIGILLITSEWSQRTALTTFCLVPHRGRVIGAKLGAMLVLAVVVTAGTLVASLLGFAIGEGLGVTSGGWQLPAVMVAQVLLDQCLGILLGAGFGLVLLNSAAAIVLSFVLPTVWSLLGSLIKALRTPAEWLDTSRTMSPLFQPDALTARQWEQLGVSLCLWLVLPMVLGLVRLRRKEIS